MFDTKIPASTTDTFDQDVRSAELVLVDFWAPWCAPCKASAPQLSKLAADNPHIKVLAVNVEENKDLAKDLFIRAVPTLQLYAKGIKVQEFIGAPAVMQANAWLRTHHPVPPSE